MYKIESHQHEAKVVICDRCGKRMSDDEPYEGYNNRTQIRFRAGYASLFGYGNKIEGDLCDECLHDLLGPYLRIVESDPDESKWYNADSGTPSIHSSTCRRGDSTRRTRRPTKWRKTSR